MDQPQTARVLQAQASGAEIERVLTKLNTALRGFSVLACEAALIHAYAFVSNGAVNWRGSADEAQRRAVFFHRASVALSQIVVDIAQMDTPTVEQQFAATYPAVAERLRGRRP